MLVLFVLQLQDADFYVHYILLVHLVVVLMPVMWH